VVYSLGSSEDAEMSDDLIKRSDVLSMIDAEVK
jgi:hypothetical protein